MKTAYIMPGTGGTFYCQNCVRDISIVHELRAYGHDVIALPMYLPPHVGGTGVETDAPMFYGAVGLYLRHVVPLLRKLPRFLTGWLDSKVMLEYAARKSGTTRASGLEEMTVSMLKGEEGSQKQELEHMMSWLKNEKGIELVHVSNALLLGLVQPVKEALDVPVVCSLQDEEQWVDCMAEPFRSQVWDMIRKRVKDVDGFISVSEYYTSLMKEKLVIPESRLHTVYPGIDPDIFELSSRPFDPPVIGYMARLAASQGLGMLVDAFILLKKEEQFRNVHLHINGGQTGDDIDFIASVKKKAADQGAADDIVFFDTFGESDRKEFLKELTVMCVPCSKGEAFGLFQIESMAAGVPVVQPEAGAYPEIIKATGGGVTYTPGNPQDLADKLSGFLKDPDLVRSMGDAGRTAVREKYTLKLCAEKTLDVYGKIRK